MCPVLSFIFYFGFLTLCTFLEMQCSFSEVSANVLALLHVYTGPMEWVLESGGKANALA